MIKILFFIDELTGGGAEKVLRTLVNNMDQSKFEITVHTIHYTDPAGYLAPGIRYRAINRCKTALGKKLFSYWVRLCAELKWLYPLYIRDDYDLEVAYLECGPTKILAGSTNKKAKKLAWVHCDLKKKGLANPEKVKAQYAKYDKVICVSQNVKESFCELFKGCTETQVLCNVVDETEIIQHAVKEVGENPCFVFLAIGRLVHQKGFDRLLDACSMLKKDGWDFRLQILGTGPEKEKLESQILQNGLCENVQLCGFVENPYPYIRTADTVVCSSRYEGMSTVVIESLILGKPIVTTPCTGMRELLGNSEYGLITEDSVEGLYRGMKQMLENPGLREEYARKAALRGKAFSKEKLVKQTEQFFEELLR
jgi:glycosyltransferase involved in cell wall biosynthesis